MSCQISSMSPPQRPIVYVDQNSRGVTLPEQLDSAVCPILVATQDQDDVCWVWFIHYEPTCALQHVEAQARDNDSQQAQRGSICG